VGAEHVATAAAAHVLQQLDATEQQRLVGFGTRLGSGCTSGHGVCGLSRLSPRSLVATCVFIATAAVTVLFARHALGGLP
jgi:uncharacterized membrane protein YedE/YeeE